MIDHHLGPRACVAWVLALNDRGPVGLRGVDLTLRAGAVPGVDLVGRRHEAAGWHAAVGRRGGEHFGVGAGHDVLARISLVEGQDMPISALTVIIAPEEEPVT